MDQPRGDLPVDAAPAEAAGGRRARRIDGMLAAAILIAAIAIIPRSLYITASQSPTTDDPYHLDRGYKFLTDRAALGELELNDPPLGEALAALPYVVMSRPWQADFHASTPRRRRSAIGRD